MRSLPENAVGWPRKTIQPAANNPIMTQVLRFKQIPVL